MCYEKIPDMEGVELIIRVTPRASSSEIVGLREDGVLLVRVTAPPAHGRANVAACRVVAAHVGVRPGSVRVVRGMESRDKVVLVEGLSPSELRRRLT